MHGSEGIRSNRGRSAEDAEADPFMLHIYAALAEKERGMIAERTRAALAQIGRSD